MMFTCKQFSNLAIFTNKNSFIQSQKINVYTKLYLFEVLTTGTLITETFPH